MRKPAFCICENKDADQLRGYREADQRLCFRYIDSTIPLVPKIRNFEPLAILCGTTAWFVSDLVGNPEDRFSHNEAQMMFAYAHSKGTHPVYFAGRSAPMLFAVKIVQYIHFSKAETTRFWLAYVADQARGYIMFFFFMLNSI